MESRAYARMLGINRDILIDWENDRPAALPPPHVFIGRTLPRERCFILRRRAGMSQAELAAKIGLSRFQVNLAEVGKRGCRRLRKFWNT